MLLAIFMDTSVHVWCPVFHRIHVYIFTSHITDGSPLLHSQIHVQCLNHTILLYPLLPHTIWVATSVEGVGVSILIPPTLATIYSGHHYDIFSHVKESSHISTSSLERFVTTFNSINVGITADTGHITPVNRKHILPLLGLFRWFKNWKGGSVVIKIALGS